MKKTISVCLSLILAVVFLTQVSAADAMKTDSKKNSQPATESVPGSSQRPVQEIGGKKIVNEVRTGAAVGMRANQLRKKDKGFAKAYKALLKRGGKPVFEKAGVSVLAIDIERPKMSKMAFNTTQDIVDGDYEISFFPVDNGDPTTWEGLIYVKSPSEEGTYAIAHDTTTLDVYYEEYFPAGGGGDDNQQIRLHRRGGGDTTALGFNASGFMAPEAAANAAGRIRDFMACLVIGLYEVAMGCRFAGPFFWGCAAVGGVAVIITCLVITW